MIKAILACDEAGGIGKNGELPWPKNPKDLEWFKNNTKNHIVVMGSNTWQAPGMPKPLPSRTNVVVTTKPDQNPGADGYIKEDLTKYLKEIEKLNPDKIVWIIGGANIIEQTLDLIEEFYITIIKHEYDCDTFLNIDEVRNKFRLEAEGNDDNTTFTIWKRK